jgi:hypothetical protein
MGNNTKVSSSKWAVPGIHKENFPFYTKLPEPEKLGGYEKIRGKSRGTQEEILAPLGNLDRAPGNTEEKTSPRREEGFYGERGFRSDSRFLPFDPLPKRMQRDAAVQPGSER